MGEWFACRPSRTAHTESSASRSRSSCLSLAKLQRRMARTRKSSLTWKKAKAGIARLHQRTTQAKLVCLKCGLSANADFISAVNIREASLACRQPWHAVSASWQLTHRRYPSLSRGTRRNPRTLAREEVNEERMRRMRPGSCLQTRDGPVLLVRAWRTARLRRRPHIAGLPARKLLACPLARRRLWLPTAPYRSRNPVLSLCGHACQ